MRRFFEAHQRQNGHTGRWRQSTGKFEGPLDLLLDEVRRQRVAIQDLEMSPLVSRFLDYARTASDRDLTLDLDWLTMAGTPIDWNSSTTERRSRPDLAQRGDREQRGVSKSGMDAFREPAAADPPEAEPEVFLSVWDLEQRARVLAAWVEQYRTELSERRRLAFAIAAEEVTIEEMAGWLDEHLKDGGSPTDLIPLLNEQSSSIRRSTLFVAALEMVPRGAVDSRTSTAV